MPTAALIASQTTMIVTAAVLFYAAFNDLKNYKIRNELILVLLGLFLFHAFLSGRWTTLYWNFGLAALPFAVMLYAYSKKLMGGGDVKLLTVALLWVGPFCALPFAIFLLFFACAHALAVKFEIVEARLHNGRKSVAFAPSIAAALTGVFVLGCLSPAWAG